MLAYLVGSQTACRPTFGKHLSRPLSKVELLETRSAPSNPGGSRCSSIAKTTACSRLATGADGFADTRMSSSTHGGVFPFFQLYANFNLQLRFLVVFARLFIE